MAIKTSWFHRMFLAPFERMLEALRRTPPRLEWPTTSRSSQREKLPFKTRPLHTPQPDPRKGDLLKDNAPSAARFRLVNDALWEHTSTGVPALDLGLVRFIELNDKESTTKLTSEERGELYAVERGMWAVAESSRGDIADVYKQGYRFGTATWAKAHPSLQIAAERTIDGGPRLHSYRSATP